jgi:hypothetical protein
MENFITGFAGHEFQVRAELRKRLGDEKYTFFSDKVGQRGGGRAKSSFSSISSLRKTQSSFQVWV